MQREYLEELIHGESLSGYLTFVDDGQMVRIPGRVQLGVEGQISFLLVCEEGSPLHAGISDSWAIFINGEKMRQQFIPKVCTFESTGGNLTLIQTGRPIQQKRIIGRPLEVIFAPKFVVADFLQHGSWRYPAALRAEIGGLTEWMHDTGVRRSIFIDREDSNQPGTEFIVLRTPNFSSVNYKVMGNELIVRPIQQPFRSATNDELGIRFRTVVESPLFSAKSWEENLKALNDFQDLVRLLSWVPFESSNLEARFHEALPSNDESGQDSDSIRSFRTSPVSDWKTVFNKRFPVTTANPNRPRENRFILRFNDLKESSLETWYSAREQFDHSLNLFLQVISAPRMSPQVKALQLGAGLESLGAKIHEGKNTGSKPKRTLARELFGYVAEPALRLFPEAFDGWAFAANSSYQAMKHLDRTLPPIGEIAKRNDQTSLIVQIWLAQLLGASDEQIQAYVSEDFRFSSQYEKVPDPSTLQLESPTD